MMGILGVLRFASVATVALITALGGAARAAAADHGTDNVIPFQGAFSYGIPFELPPFRGLEGAVTLVYSSEAGNGFAGVGWSLAGLSTIQRVSEHEGVPNWDAGDTYVLNGVKLLPCQSGVIQSPSCDNGGTHTAEKENLQKIVHDDVADTWTTWAPNGVRSVYTPIISAPSGTLRYGRTRVQDTLGNQVNATWVLDQGDAYPATITYGNYEVQFHRELRPDPIGFPLETTVQFEKYRLKSVVVKRSGGAVIRAYALNYTTSPQTGRSLLASVSQYGTDAIIVSGAVTGGTGLPPQTFTYQEDPAGRAFVEQGVPYPEAGDMANCDYGASGDFNGDGVLDAVCVESGLVDVALGPSGPVSRWLDYGMGGNWRPIPADIDRDGKTDLVGFRQSPGEMWVSLSTGSAFEAPVFWGAATAFGANTCRLSQAVFYGSGNFDGDDLPDVYCRTTDDSAVLVGINTGSSFEFGVWGNFTVGAWEVAAGAADFDGDGLDDFWGIGGDNNAFKVRRNTGLGSFAGTFAPVSPIGFCGASNYLVGDYDANGLTDIACPNSGKLALSSGLYFHEQPVSAAICTGRPVRLAADVDGDGASELVCMKDDQTPSDVHVYEWTGSALVGPEIWDDDWCPNEESHGFLDANADGKPELRCKTDGGLSSAGTPALKPDLMIAVANGLGGTTQVTYTASTSFANTNGPPVKYAVTSLTTNDGRGSVATTSFEYAGGLMDWADGEFRGFGYVKRTLPCIAGETLCPYVETWLHQDDELTAGRPSRVERHGGDGSMISAQEFTYVVTEPVEGGGVTPETVYLLPNATTQNDMTTVTGAPSNKPEQAVDDPYGAPDENTTRISNTASTSSARFTHAGLGLTPASISKVSVVFRARANSSSAGHTIKARIRIGGINYDGASQNLTTSYTDYADTWTSNPSTGGPWTLAAVNSLEFGMRANGSSGVGARLTQIGLVVEYLPQPPPGPPTQEQDVTRIALLTAATDYTYDGSGAACGTWPCANGKRRKTTFDYDGYANRVQSISHGDMDAAGDELTTVTTYLPNPTPYIVGAPAQVEVFEGVGTGGTKLSSRRFVYDGAPDWQTPPSAGRVTQAQAWLDTEDRYISSTIGHDGVGNVVSQTDPTGRSTSITYDTTDNLFPVSVTNPAGETATTVWDPVCGAPLSATDPNSQTATQQYDALCRLTRRDGPLGVFEEYSYLNLGNPNLQHTRVETPSPTGAGVHYATSYFDGFGRGYRGASTGPSGSDIVAETSYDLRGRVVASTQPYYEGATPLVTSYEYDGFDRPVRTNLPDGTPLVTSYGLWEVTSQDAHGHPSTARFDSYGRKIESQQMHDGQPVVTTYEYDALGRMIGMSDAAGNAWGWMFDSLGRNEVIDDPDAGIRTSVFDDAGRPLEVLDALGQKTTFGYDSGGRLQSRSVYHANESLYRTISYAYSEARPGYFNAGRLTSVTSPVDVLRTDYDALGRSVRAQRDFEGKTYTLDTTFNAAGATTSVRPAGAEPPGQTPVTIAYQYDAAGRLAAMPGILTSLTHDAAGRPLVQQNANGTTTTRNFDAQRGFLESINTTGPGGTLQSLGYGYDAAGMLTGVSSSFDNEMWSYGYDDLHRLTDATNITNPENTTSYSYDVVGNMTYNSQVGTLVYPIPGGFRPHAPTSVNGTGYSYDANGQLTQAGTETHTWNPDGSLQAKNASFVYGSGGAPDRLKVVAGGTTSIYPFGDDYEVTNGVVTNYVSAPGLGIVAKIVIDTTQTKTHWLHTDRQGSVNVVTNNLGAQELRRTYRPYGEEQSEDGSHVESRGYIDQRVDGSSNLMYLHHRYYDPRIGLFVSPDPIGPAGGLNQYAYAGSDPTTWSDRSGLRSKDEVGIAIIAAGESGSASGAFGWMTPGMAGGFSVLPWLIDILFGGGDDGSGGIGYVPASGVVGSDGHEGSDRVAGRGPRLPVSAPVVVAPPVGPQPPQPEPPPSGPPGNTPGAGPGSGGATAAAANFSAGLGHALTFGATDYIRDVIYDQWAALYGWDGSLDPVNPEAAWFAAGQAAGTAWWVAGTATWAWPRLGLPTMNVAIGPGASPAYIHVAYGAGQGWVHASGRALGHLRVVSQGAQAFVQNESWRILTGIPVWSEAGVTACGMRAWTCVGAAGRAFLRGWGF